MLTVPFHCGERFANRHCAEMEESSLKVLRLTFSRCWSNAPCQVPVLGLTLLRRKGQSFSASRLLNLLHCFSAAQALSSGIAYTSLFLQAGSQDERWSLFETITVG